MHNLHGNTLSLRICNINGLDKPGRKEFICDETFDFMSLTETHANQYRQATFTRDLQEHGCFWGKPMGNRQFAGVAFVYRKASAWAVHKVDFKNGDCERFYNDGRLLRVQIFRQLQRRSIVVYVVYGKSGGRWEADKKRYNCSLLKAVHEVW